MLFRSGGIAFAGYMTAVPVLTALTDRIDSRRIYLGACGLSALGAAGFALTEMQLVSYFTNGRL